LSYPFEVPVSCSSRNYTAESSFFLMYFSLSQQPIEVTTIFALRIHGHALIKTMTKVVFIDNLYAECSICELCLNFQVFIKSSRALLIMIPVSDQPLLKINDSLAYYNRIDLRDNAVFINSCMLR